MRYRWVAVAAILVLAFAACGDATTTTAPEDDAPIDAAATPTQEPTTGGDATEPATERAPGAAPDFSVTTFDGARFTLSEKTGMPVVINFFDSW